MNHFDMQLKELLIKVLKDQPLLASEVALLRENNYLSRELHQNILDYGNGMSIGYKLSDKGISKLRELAKEK